LIKRIKVDPLLIVYFLLCMYFGSIKFYLSFLFCLLIHEIGHIFLILLYKGQVIDVCFNIFGGVINYKLNKESNKLLICMGRNTC